MGEDPTILAFETGNELGGSTGTANPPPIEWTTAVSLYLKELAPNTLVIDGSYGIQSGNLPTPSVDI
jgi:hypothetical protein